MEVVELACGGLLIAYRAPGDTIALAVGWPVGSIHDPPGLSGLAHLLEHVLFRGNELVTAREVDECFELSGGEANGFTYHDATIVYFEVSVEGYTTALHTLARMLRGRRIPVEGFEAEKKLAYSEALEARENPQERVVQYAMRALYGDTPLGRPVEGTPEDINRIQLEDLVAFREKYLTCDNMVAVLVGPITREHVEKAVEELGSLPCCGDKPPEPRLDPAGPGSVQEQCEGLEACYLAVAWSLPGVRDEPRIPLWLGVLGFNMGAGATSTLFRLLRLEDNLAYDYHEEHDYHRSTSYLLAAAYSVDCSRAEEALEKLVEAPWKTLESLRDEGYVEGRKRYYSYLTSPGRVDNGAKAVSMLLRMLRKREPLGYEEARCEVLEADWSSIPLPRLLLKNGYAILEPG